MNFFTLSLLTAMFMLGASLLPVHAQIPVPLADLNSGTANSTPQCFVELGGKLYFTAITNGGTQRQLFSYNPALPLGSQVVRLSSFAPPTATTTFPNLLRAVGTKLLMVSQSTANGTELHEYDPANGSITEIPLNGTIATQPRNFLVHEGKLYFQGHNGDRPLSWTATAGGSPLTGGRGTQLYVYDPAQPKAALTATNANPKVLTDLNANNYGGSGPANLVGIPGKLFFSAFVAYADNQWGTQGSGRLGGGWYTTDDEELVMLDTVAQTNVVFQIAQGSFTGTFNATPYTDQLDSHPLAQYVVVSNVLYFSASPTVSPHGSANYRGQCLMKFDPATMSAPALVAEVNVDVGQVGATEAAGDNITSITNVGSMIYYSATDGGTNRGAELWAYDTVNNTNGLAADIAAGTASSSPANLTAFNGKLYFSASANSHGTELWELNPATGAVREVADINAGAGSSSPAGFLVFDGRLFFRASTTAGGSELYYYDPATDTVSLVSDLNAGSGSGASGFNSTTAASLPTAAVFNNQLYYQGNNGTTSPGIGSEPFYLAASAVITAATNGVLETGGAVTWSIVRNSNTNSAVTVSYTVGGSATLGSDYTQSGIAGFSTNGGTITFAAGATNLTFTTTPIADSDTGETDETIIISLTRIVAPTTTNTLSSSATLVLTNIAAPPNSAPVVARNNASVSVNEGSSVTNTGTFSDADGNATVTLTASAGSLTKNNGAGTWSWSLATTDGPDQSQTVTVTATDGLATNSTTFSLVVSNIAPTAASQSVVINEDSSTNLVLTATDPGADTITNWNLTVPPAHGSFTGTAPNLTYTPAGDYNGSDSFKFTATDSDGATSAEATVTLTINPVNDAPLVGRDAANVYVNEGSSTTNVGTFLDVDGNASVTLTASVGSLTKDDLTSSWTWNYSATDGPAQSQLVTITATDGLATNTATFNLIVSNLPPVAAPQAIVIDEDTPTNLVLTATDPGTDSITNWSITAPPAHGSLIGTAPNVTYAPDTNYNGGDSFKFTATDSDGATSAEATVSLTLNPVNDAPWPNPIADLTVNAGTVIQLTATAFDVEGDAMTFSVLSPPTYSTFTPAGDFAWRPRVAQAATTNPIAVVITDNGSPNRASTNVFNIIVNPLAATLSIPVLSNGLWNFTVQGTSNPDYVVLSSTNFVDWKELATNLSAITPFPFTDPDTNTTVPETKKFYRVRMSP